MPGDRIALAMPDFALTTNNNIVFTNVHHYRGGARCLPGRAGRWGRWSDAGGSSLGWSLARSDNRLAANWRPARVGPKHPGRRFGDGCARQRHCRGGSTAGCCCRGGECLIDDVEVRTVGGGESCRQPTFESGAAGWTAEGTQEQSDRSLRKATTAPVPTIVRASDRGDNQVNRIRTG